MSRLSNVLATNFECPAGNYTTAVKPFANLAALKTKDWIDADTTQQGGKTGGLDATTIRNHDANALYENLLLIQNAADLQWPDDAPANTGLRAAFRLDVFPPRGGTTATTAAPAAATATPVAK